MTTRSLMASALVLLSLHALSPEALADEANWPELLQRMQPGSGDVTIPATLYTPAVRAAEKERLRRDPVRWKALEERADRYASIPLEQWQELIPDRSAAPLNDEGVLGTSQYKTDKSCIICGAVPGNQYEGWDLLHSPFALKTSCCRITIHERPADRTAADAPIVGHVEIPHYDGQPRMLDAAESTFYTQEGQAVRWYPANVVWAHRLARILGNWREGVVPDLRDAYLATGDLRYATSLAAVLSRLAAVFPAWPVSYHNGVAPLDHRALVSAAALHEPLGSHTWLGPSRLVAASANFRPPMEGYVTYLLISGYMAIADAPVWGDGDTARQAVRTGLFDELKLVIDAYGANQTMGNGIGMYAPGLLATGILYRDHYLYDGVLSIMEEFLYNETYYDGISTEGSTNYAGMVGGMVGLFDTAGLTSTPGYLEVHPLLARMGTTQSRLTTLRGLMSAHGDGPNHLFGMSETMVNADAGSDIMGGFGISVLRAGPLEHRTELIFQHDRSVGHAHDNQLGIQLFYRGLPLLQYLGDSRLGRFIDLRDDKNPFAARLKALPYPAPMIESDMERKSFSMALPTSPYTKNTLVIDDYSHQAVGRAPWRGGFGTPGFPTADLITAITGDDLQFIEAEGRNLMRYQVQGMQLLRRGLILVTRPDGRSYIVDIIRAAGGNRHLMLYMSRGTELDSTLRPNGTTYETQQAWLDATAPERLEWMPKVVDAVGDLILLHNLRMVQNPGPRWHHTWQLKMADWAPRFASAEERAWMDAIPPGYLRVHGVLAPQARYSDIWRASAHYPASIDETFGDGENDRQRGMVEFQDALHFIGMLQQSAQRLAATHVHVLEPWAEDEGPIIDTITWLAADTEVPGHVGLRLTFTDGSQDSILYTPPATTSISYPDVPKANARIRLLRQMAGAPATERRIPHPLRGSLVELRGDITGDRSRSLLIVQPQGDWPALEALKGLAISVGFNRNQRLETYTIAEVTPGADGQLQIELAGAPPFIDHFGKVLVIGPDGNEARGPQTGYSFIGVSTAKGGGFHTTYHHGSRLIFPAQGVAFTVKGGEERVQQGARYDLAEEVELQALGIQAGTPFILAPDWRGGEIRVHLKGADPQNQNEP